MNISSKHTEITLPINFFDEKIYEDVMIFKYLYAEETKLPCDFPKANILAQNIIKIFGNKLHDLVNIMRLAPVQLGNFLANLINANEPIFQNQIEVLEKKIELLANDNSQKKLLIQTLDDLKILRNFIFTQNLMDWKIDLSDYQINEQSIDQIKKLSTKICTDIISSLIKQLDKHITKV
jgi:uncharacterized protein YejL (UPF0352 family)